MSAASTARLEPKGRTNYQVHRRTSVGWEFRTARLEMDAAIKEAKRCLELPGTEAVRVVRDHYDPATNSFRPNTVFRATAPAPSAVVKPGFWARLQAARPTAAGGRPAKRSKLIGQLAASLIGVALGMVVTLLRP